MTEPLKNPKPNSDAASNTPRLVLLPGLGADERLFAGLDVPGFLIETPRLLIPEPKECMLSYSLRVARALNLRPEDWIGGASFGSLVAADIARHRPLAGLVLIGGALSSASIPRGLILFAQLSKFLPARALLAFFLRPVFFEKVFAPMQREHAEQLVEMLAATPTPFLREGGRLVSGYFSSLNLLCPVHAIHGKLDHVMRPPAVPDCRLVANAGHALALTHPGIVADFLRERLVGPPG